MLSLGKWLCSNACLLLVLFTGLGSAGHLNYLDSPMVNTTGTKRGPNKLVNTAERDRGREVEREREREREREKMQERKTQL